MKIYNWDDIPRDVARAGVVRQVFTTQSAMLVLNELHPGMEINPHSHPFEQIVYILTGSVAFTVNGERYHVGPGSVFRIPPNAVHFAEALGDEVALNLDVFAPPREDYLHLANYDSPVEDP